MRSQSAGSRSLLLLLFWPLLWLFISLELIQLIGPVDGFRPSSLVSRPVKSIYAKTRNASERLINRARGRHTAPQTPPLSPIVAPYGLVSGGPSSGQERNNRGIEDKMGVSASLDTDGHYGAKCLVERDPSWKRDPALYFYSAPERAQQTRGCKEEHKIVLKTINSDSDEDPELELDEASIKREYIDTGLYDGSLPTYFITHGFLASWNSDTWLCDAKDLILDNARANVFIVDWSGGAKPVLPVDYSAAVSNTKYIGQIIASFVNSIIKLSGQRDGSNFHLIGHSLGAHISGFIGYSVPSIGRITGLDPAGPCFSTKPKSGTGTSVTASTTGYLEDGTRRLSPESAKLVVALHTDTAFFGLNENCGHYDVYINGGYKQPKCGSVDLTSRVEDFFKLDWANSLNPNIACAHSYAHGLVDTFTTWFGGGSQDNNERASENLTPDRDDEDKCYPMAYRCESWELFKAGECGFCVDNDIRCVYTGLSVHDTQKPKVEDPNISRTMADTEARDDMSDDDKFNDEDEDSGDDDSKMRPSTKYSNGQHYLKSGTKPHTCLYQYQVIVAAKRSAIQQIDNAKRHYYYLHIPLEQSGRLELDGERQHDRLIQVSHKIEYGTEAYQFLRNQYAKHMSSLNKYTNLPVGDIEFYTTLVTFKQAPKEQCADQELDGATKSEQWQLCRPLNKQIIKEARLWSSSESKLAAAQWVTMNFMSGVELSQRVANTLMFKRDPKEKILARSELTDKSRADVEQLAPSKPNGALNTLTDAASKPVDCFLSLFDHSQEAKLKRSFKCNRSSSELKYAVKLRIIKF